MRRRRDEADARPREPQPRDHFVDLVTRQLPAFAGLRALRDLDLQHFGIDQVLRRHAESARSDLLDLGVLLGVIARRIFAAFAGIRAAAEAIHRDRERLVRFRRQRAERHARAIEALENRLDGFDLARWVSACGPARAQQIAQRRHRPFVHKRGELPVHARRRPDDRGLQRRDDIRVVRVVLAVVHVLEQPAVLDRISRDSTRARRET